MTPGGTTATGSYPLTVTASGLLNGVQTIRSAGLTLQVGAAGQTLLTGQVLDEDAKPLPGVTLKLANPPTVLGTTDAAGNFLFPLSLVGSQIFIVDGSTAAPSGTYPTIAVTATIIAGQANTLGYTPHLHRQPATQPLPVAPSTPTKLTFAEVPGLEATIPAGVTITGWDGQPNTQMGARLVPLDRLAIPPPPPTVETKAVYMFNFGKVGGGLPSAPVPVTYPNTTGAPPGAQVQMWFFNEAPDGSAPNAWQMYGLGTVSSDGTKVVPNAGVGMPRFCCGGGFLYFARFDFPPPPQLQAALGPLPTSSGGTKGGEPVDLATGFFTLSKTDLVLPGRLPVVLTRTYRSEDPNIGSFGVGGRHAYDPFLVFPTTTGQLVLVLPDLTRYALARQADGTYMNTTDPALRGVVATLSGPNRLLTFKDKTVWTFDGTGRLIGQADRNGNTLTIARDGQGRVTALTEPAGRRLTFSYSGTSLSVSQITDPLGRVVSYTYDGGGRLATVTDPAGGVTRYTYDAQGRMLTLTNPRGITYLTNTYDANGRVVRQAQADGGLWQFAYTVTAGTVTQTTVTDPRGNPTTSRFNGQGYLLSQTDALGQTTTLTRDPATNLLLATIDPLGRTTRLAYDTAGNVTAITDPAGNTRAFTYEPTFNRLTGVTDPAGNTTRFAYDAAGSLVAVTDRLGAVTQIGYNQFGQPNSITNAVGNIVQFTYNAQGDPERFVDSLGNTITRGYDAVSRVIRHTDPRGHATTFEYDPLTRVTATVDALGNATAFTYDPNGNVLTVTDARGNTMVHDYDGMDRLSRRLDPLGAVETFAYDLAGNLIESVDRKGQRTRFAYDVLDRRVNSEYADGGVLRFAYDAGGRLVQADDTADPQGPIRREYDGWDHLLRETTALGTISYQYDALGRRLQMVVAGQSAMAYTYDATSRLRAVTQAPLNPTIFDYDASGRRTSMTLPNGVNIEYQYDGGSRLVALVYRNSLGVLGGLAYDYDPAGNRIAMGGTFARTLLPDLVPSATYDAGNRQLTFGNKTMTYDANGNLTSLTDPGGTTALTWDARNRLTALMGPGLTASFGYDSTSRRALKTLLGQTTAFQYDGLDVVREVVAGTILNYVRALAVDEALAMNELGESAYYLLDALGSSLALLDGAGSLITTYTYGPFGQGTSSGAASRNTFQYTGREQDGTGFYFYRLRYYHPGLSRFVSEDPMRLWDGINFYAYGGNNPVNKIDPLGLWAGVDDAIFAGGGAVVGLAGQAISDLLSGQLSGWEDYVGAAIGGAVGGEALPYTGPIGAGLAGGAAGNLTKQARKNLSGKQCGFDVENFLLETGVGGLTGVIPGTRIPGITAGRNSFNATYRQMATKFQNGTISDVSARTAAKMAVGRAVDTAVLPGAGAGAGALSGSTALGLVTPSEKKSPCSR